MPEIWNLPQSDGWLRARCGRITGSQMKKVVSYLKVNRAPKKAGDSSVERDKYRRAVIGERLTGKLANHWESEYMARGTAEEPKARVAFETLAKVMVLPVSFVIHPEFRFWGATADGLIGTEGILEMKNPETANHLAYWEDGYVPEEYVPQVATEIACAPTGKLCRYAAFFSHDSRIHDPFFQSFLKRVGRDELEWNLGTEKDPKMLTGEAVIDYFTAEAIKLNAEIEAFISQGTKPPIAPFEPRLKEDDEEEGTEPAPDESGAAFDPSGAEFAYFDGIDVAP